MRKNTILMIVAGAVPIVLATLVTGKKPGTVPFNHKKHLVDVGMACLDCHAGAATATTSAESLIPALEGCYGCHDQADVKWDVPADGASPWTTPELELVFDHAGHAARGIECASCHVGIENATKAPSHAMPEMSVCTDCHHKQEISDDCNVCHSEVQFLRPKDHVADWVLDHRIIARSDAKTCETCHRQSYCSECHEGAALGLAVVNKADNPVDRIGPMQSAHESSKNLILQRAHSLNYRFTHGSDVRTKSMDCSTCHETQTFCNACHDPTNGANPLRPVWHDVAGFEAHTHAEYARRDIETCASCHDQSGADPSCMRCHKSIVSPHPAGFMQEVNGPWHNDNNAVCFACHDIGSRTSGVGFCGKCHG